jgi:hypothetical protein
MRSRSDPTGEHPSPYAPIWGRDAADPQQRSRPHTIQTRNQDGEGAEEKNAVRNENNSALKGAGDPPARGDLYINHFRLPRSLAPGIVPEPWAAARARYSRGIFGTYGRLILAVSIAAGVALYFVAKSPRSSLPGDSAETSSFGPRFAGQSSAQPTARLPQLVVTAGVLQATGKELPLGVSVRGASDGAALVISGLPDGSTLSTGQPLGTNSWHLPTADLGDAVLRPPRGFVGDMNLALELHLIDDTIADRQFLHVEWAGMPIEAAPGVALRSAATAGAESPAAFSAKAPDAREGVEIGARAAAASTLTSHAIRELDPDAIATLLKHGEELIAAGDIAGARVLLRRAAEARDAQAALTLGATYDPVALQKLDVRGISPDIAVARSWYEKAKEFGSAEGQSRLELLASPYR